MKVLIALDASQSGEYILAEVIGRRWPDGSTFQVLTATEAAPRFALGETMGSVGEESKKLVSSAAERLQSHGLEASGQVIGGDPKSVILDQAAAWPADLILVGPHGGGTLERFLLGSVSRAILRHATCSVEVVRRKARATPEGYFDRCNVLLAVDGSDAAPKATEAVAAMAWPGHMEVRVLSAVELHLSALRAAFEIPALDPTHLRPQKEEAMARAQKAILAALAVLEKTGVTLSESLSVLLEPPKQIILEEAETWDADLIVMGSHGGKGVSRFLLGSTSEAVAGHAKCSVKVVR